MNTKYDGSSSLDGAEANENIVISVDGKRRNLSNLSTLRNKVKSEQPSLYPSLSDLPRIETADTVWASSARQLRADGKEATDTVDVNTSTEEESEGLTGLADAVVKGSMGNVENIIDDPYSSDDDAQSIDRRMVEVTEGHFVPLRGADETLQALDDGQVTQTKCVFCGIALVVHEGASMVICPHCEMIAPLAAPQGDSEHSEASLGLGLRLESLQLSSPDEDDTNTRKKPKEGHLKTRP